MKTIDYKELFPSAKKLPSIFYTINILLNTFGLNGIVG